MLIKFINIKLIFFVIFTLNLSKTFSQSDSLTVNYQLNKLKDKKIYYHKLTKGEYDGYRVKIHFGQDRNKATEIKTKFLSKYRDADAYENYIQPNFVIVVGDFKTKPEAFGFLTKIKSDFPAAFIVKDKIRPKKHGN
jgi:hypothetical protein